MTIIREEEGLLIKTVSQERDSPGLIAYRRLLEMQLERAKMELINAEPEQIFAAQGHARGLQLALKYLKA